MKQVACQEPVIPAENRWSRAGLHGSDWATVSVNRLMLLSVIWASCCNRSHAKRIGSRFAVGDRLGALWRTRKGGNSFGNPIREWPVGYGSTLSTRNGSPQWEASRERRAENECCHSTAKDQIGV